MSREPEDIEAPFVAWLQAPGWTHIAGSPAGPAATGRVRVTPLLAVSGP
jgi:hypothetical protein